MARLKAGQTITLTLSVTDDNGDAEDADTLTFKWKEGLYGCVEEETPTKTGTGAYSVEITPEVGGNVHYVWIGTDADGDAICEENVLSVKPSNFDLSA